MTNWLVQDIPIGTLRLTVLQMGEISDDLFHVQAEIDDPDLCPLWVDEATLRASRNRIIAAISRENARFSWSHITRIFSADIFPPNSHEVSA